MADTPTLGLPLLAPAQAQKHVTVNEALARLDALAQLTLYSRVETTPPGAPAEGAAYAVGAGASDAWAGMEGQLALWINGGWAFVAPRPGWRAWIADEGVPAMFDGGGWVAGSGSLGTSGAGTVLRVIESDHDVAPGARSETPPMIPSHAVVLGITARVLDDLGSAATGWSLGVPDSEDRYGTGYGTGQGAWARGLTGSPLTYWGDTPLVLTAEGGEFAGGRVRLAVHLAELTLPRP